MGYPLYETYVPSKLNWLDEIPTGWDIIPIKFGLEIPITDGPHETPEIFNEGIPFLSAESVKNDKLDFNRKRGFISSEDHKRFSKKYKPKRGDVYMVKSGATTGNMARVETDEEFNIWSPLAAMRPDDKMLTTDFLFFFMKSKPFFHSVELNWNYGTQQNIGMGVIANLQMALPPVAIQKKISTFLERKTQQIDQLIKKKKELIEKFEEQRIAVITQAVTKGINENAKLKPSGVDWLGDVPEHWLIRPLKYFVKFIDGDRSSEYPSGNDILNEGVPFLSSKNIVNNKLNLTGLQFISQEKYDRLGRGKLIPRDILITVRGSVGNVAIYNPSKYETGFINAQMTIARALEQHDPEYLYLIMNSIVWLEQINYLSYGTAQQQLSNNLLEQLMVAIPQEKEEQINITKKLNSDLEKIDNMKTANLLAIEKLEEYRSAIITSAVTGKIDVRNIAIPEASNKDL